MHGAPLLHALAVSLYHKLYRCDWCCGVTPYQRSPAVSRHGVPDLASLLPNGCLAYCSPSPSVLHVFRRSSTTDHQQ